MKNFRKNLFFGISLMCSTITFAQEIAKDTVKNTQLEEVVIIGKGLMGLAKDRKTPIAVSSITALRRKS